MFIITLRSRVYLVYAFLFTSHGFGEQRRFSPVPPRTGAGDYRATGMISVPLGTFAISTRHVFCTSGRDLSRRT